MENTINKQMEMLNVSVFFKKNTSSTYLLSDYKCIWKIKHDSLLDYTEGFIAC